MPDTMPVAVIANATRPEQAYIVCTLADWPEAAQAAALASPAIIVVGQVAALADVMRNTSGSDVGDGRGHGLREDPREHVA